MKKLFLISPQSTKASEVAGLPGDNALHAVSTLLRREGYEIIGSEVALLPSGKPIDLKRRLKALKKHKEADLTILFGSDVMRKTKSWFPVREALASQQPYYFIKYPTQFLLKFLPLLKERLGGEEVGLVGYNENTNEIGG